MSGVHLLDVAVEGPGPCPLGSELLLRSPRDQHGHENREWDGDQGNDRQQRTDPDHHGQHAHDGQRRREDLRHPLLQGGRDVVDIVGDPAEQVAMRMAVEVFQRQPRHLRFDVLT